MCNNSYCEREKENVFRGAYRELYKIKSHLDDLFSALLEENSLMGKLVESRVRTVRMENVMKERELQEPSLVTEMKETESKVIKTGKVSKKGEKGLTVKPTQVMTPGKIKIRIKLKQHSRRWKLVKGKEE